MSEILQGLELPAQAQGNASEAEPVVDMRSARLLPATTGTTDSPHLPQIKVMSAQVESGETEEPERFAAYSIDTDTEDGLDVKGLLTQLLTFPRPKDGVVPDSWGNDKRAEVKRISTDLDSVYTLNRTVQRFIDDVKDDFQTFKKGQSA